MDAKMHDFDKKFMSKENKLYARLHRLKNKLKNLDEYLKKIMMKKFIQKIN